MSARRELAFVRAIQKCGRAIAQQDGGYMVSQSGRAVRQPLSVCRKLVAQGVLCKSDDSLMPTAQTAVWIRRQLVSGADQFAAQHRAVIKDDAQRLINLNESPLAKLKARSGDKTPLLDHHLAAGEHFWRLFERAAIRQRVTMSYDPERIAQSGGGGPADQGLSGMAMDARRELDRICTSLPAECVGVIMDVCGFEKGLQQVELERGWPRRSAKLVLRIGLEQLAAHFGLSRVAKGPTTKPINGWRQEGARPTRLR